MGDAGEGLVDAEARIQERMEELEAERRNRGGSAPKIDPEKDKLTPAPCNEFDVSQEEAIRQCVESAGRSLVVLSGGSRIADEKLLEQTGFIMKAGGSGVIYGRNVWQREWSEALEIVAEIKESLLANVTRIP